MSNVVAFNARKPAEPTKDEILNDLVGLVVDWAESNGVDTSDTEFKWDAATIRSVAQGLLHRKGI